MNEDNQVAFDELRVWLKRHNARICWQAETPRGPLDCYLLDGDLIYVQFLDYAGSIQGFELFVNGQLKLAPVSAPTITEETEQWHPPHHPFPAIEPVSAEPLTK